MLTVRCRRLCRHWYTDPDSMFSGRYTFDSMSVAHDAHVFASEYAVFDWGIRTMPRGNVQVPTCARQSSCLTGGPQEALPTQPSPEDAAGPGGTGASKILQRGCTQGRQGKPLHPRDACLGNTGRRQASLAGGCGVAQLVRETTPLHRGACSMHRPRALWRRRHS